MVQVEIMMAIVTGTPLIILIITRDRLLQRSSDGEGERIPTTHFVMTMSHVLTFRLGSS